MRSVSLLLLVTSVGILLWINFSMENSLSIAELIITFFSTISGVMMVSIHLVVNTWMEILTKMANQLVKNYDEMGEGNICMHINLQCF